MADDPALTGSVMLFYYTLNLHFVKPFFANLCVFYKIQSK